jgi:uncharacterized protein YjbI with pentapeptide repeats
MPKAYSPKKKQKLIFAKKQYEILKRCSENKDIKEWNKYLKDNPKRRVFLEGAKLREAYLNGADLCGAHLDGAELNGAHLNGAKLIGAHLNGANLNLAHLNGANLTEAHLNDAALFRAQMNGAQLIRAHLNVAVLAETHLNGAQLMNVRLNGAYLKQAHLNGAIFEAAIVDGETLIWDCTLDEGTNFAGVGLDSARINPRLKESLKNNIRKKQWEKWYGEADCWQKKISNYLIVKPFWWISDYGSSTKKIIKCFFVLALIFATFYWALGVTGYYLCSYKLCPIDNFFFCSVGPVESVDGYSVNPGAIDNLFVIPGVKLKKDIDTEGISIFNPIFMIRSAYFSIVTMTTLGFGDMHAKSGSWLGHILLIFQVVMGYVLLGALVTRFAILFGGGGPAEDIKTGIKKPGRVKRVLNWLKRTFCK